MNLELLPARSLPEVASGDKLAPLIAERAELQGGDIVVIAQKVVSKAEGCAVDPSSVTVTEQARALALQTDKSPELTQLILDQSKEVLRASRGALIVETHHGFVCANAGIDASNVPAGRLLTLPQDPDRSAREIRHELQVIVGQTLGVIISDSFGRAWRNGQADVAIGCAGIEPLLDLRGSLDANGRELTASVQAVADELSGAADLARSKSSNEAVVVIRGRGDLVTVDDGPGVTASLRELSHDLFR